MRSPHTSYRWRGERDIETIKWMGVIRRPWLTRARGGNLARTPGLHPTLYEKCHGIFNDHRESGPRFNVSSSERRCLLTVWCPHHYTGALGPTQTTGWAPPAGLTNTSSRFWMKGWSLIYCQVFSNLIRHYRRTPRAVKPANGGFIKVLKKRVPLIVANVY